MPPGLIRHDDYVRDQRPEGLEPIENDAERVVRGRVPMPVWALVLGAAVLVGGGGVLVGRATSGDGATSKTTPKADTSIAQPTEVSSGLLALAPGGAAVEWSFVVFDPTGRTLNVSVDELSPPDTDLKVAVRASDGRFLDLGRTTGSVCDRRTVHAVCKLGPIALDGARPGTWVVHIEKRSQADARVAITIRLDG